MHPRRNAKRATSSSHRFGLDAKVGLDAALDGRYPILDYGVAWCDGVTGNTSRKGNRLSRQHLLSLVGLCGALYSFPGERASNEHGNEPQDGKEKMGEECHHRFNASTA